MTEDSLRQLSVLFPDVIISTQLVAVGVSGIGWARSES